MIYFRIKYLHKHSLEVIYAIIRYSGTGYLFRKIFARNSVTIIAYHNPNAIKFEEHLRYLLHRYNIISLSDLYSAIYHNAWDTLPLYPLLITIDDGWKENYNLLEIIRKYKIRPVIFLTSHLVNTYRNYWWTIGLRIEDINRLKKVPNHQRLTDLYNNFNYYPEKEFPENRQVLNISEIQQMRDVVDFGLHTCSHPVLTKCTGEEKRNEIIECRRRIEEILGSDINSFAYPNGDFDIESISILKENGIKIARTMNVGRNNKMTNPFTLKVTGVSDDGSLNKLASELTGIPLFFQHLLKGLLL